MEAPDNLTTPELTAEQKRKIKVFQERLATGMEKLMNQKHEQIEVVLETEEIKGCSGCPMGDKLKLVVGGLILAGLVVGYFYFKTPDSPCLIEIPNPE